MVKQINDDKLGIFFQTGIKLWRTLAKFLRINFYENIKVVLAIKCATLLWKINVFFLVFTNVMFLNEFHDFTAVQGTETVIIIMYAYW